MTGNCPRGQPRGLQELELVDSTVKMWLCSMASLPSFFKLQRGDEPQPNHSRTAGQAEGEPAGTCESQRTTACVCVRERETQTMRGDEVGDVMGREAGM